MDCKEILDIHIIHIPVKYKNQNRVMIPDFHCMIAVTKQIHNSDISVVYI